jgi:hypothetical protein
MIDKHLKQGLPDQALPDQALPDQILPKLTSAKS